VRASFLIQLTFIRCLTRRPGYPCASRLHFALAGHHLILEAASKLEAEEAHHVARAEVERAVLAQPGNQLLEVCGPAKQDVGRVLGLGRNPVVLHRVENFPLPEQRIDSQGMTAEHMNPVDPLETAGQLLRSLDVAQPHEDCRASCT
jgi:hypothetical protein